MTDDHSETGKSTTPNVNANDSGTGETPQREDRWTEQEIAEIWASAPAAHRQLAELYCKERALNLSLISVDEMREALLGSKPSAKKFPALIFSGTDDNGTITRLQAVRFKAKPLKDKAAPRAVRLDKAPKTTAGSGSAPARFAALPDCNSSEILIADGPEDAMTLRQVFGKESWASLGDSNIGGLPVRSGQRVVVFADRHSEDKVAKQAQSLMEIGALVRLAPPPDGFKDVNEALQNGRVDLIREAYAKAAKIDPPADLGIPTGFRLKAGGIERRVEQSDGNHDWMPVCSWLRVAATSRDKASTDWGRLIEVRDPDGELHRRAIPSAMFAGDGTRYREILLDLGLTIAAGRHPNRDLHNLLQSWQPPARARTTDRLGWADETFKTFVLPQEIIGGDGGEDVVFQSVSEPVNARVLVAKGSVEDWRENIASLCVGNPILMFCASAAFAAPLLGPLGLESGGVHLKGASSTGKSTAQHLAVSVWGAPKYMQQWRATANGLEGVASAHNSMLLVLDEIGQIDAKEAGQAAYMLANEGGKIRATTTGNARRPKNWRLLFLSSGEVGIDDKIKETGTSAKAGQLVRVLDIPATDRQFGVFDGLREHETGDQFAQRITKLTADYYGVAGVEFVHRFLANLDENIESARGTVGQFRKMALDALGLSDPDGQVLRALDRFAVIAAGGVLASKFELTGWEAKDVFDACLTVFRLWLEDRGGSGSAEMADTLRRVRHFISSAGSGRFEDIERESDKGRVILKRAGWKHKVNGEEVYSILPGVWNDEVFNGADSKRAARLLADAGHLLTEAPDRLMRKVPGRAAKGQRCFCVRASILADDSIEEDREIGSIPVIPPAPPSTGTG